MIRNTGLHAHTGTDSGRGTSRDKFLWHEVIHRHFSGTRENKTDSPKPPVPIFPGSVDPVNLISQNSVGEYKAEPKSST